MKKAAKHSKKSVLSVTHENVKVNYNSNTANESNSLAFKTQGHDPSSPLKFETFIPWMCEQMAASTPVVITPKFQDNFRRKSITRQIAKLEATRSLEESSKLESITKSMEDNFRRKSIPRQIAKLEATRSLEESSKLESITKSMEGLSTDLVPVTAYYDTKQRLVEIAIEGTAVRASKKVIAAFGFCVPYHTSLTRFTYRRSLLTAPLIYEINKLLPISNISEIVFDDSYVPEANYYILLEQISHLKYLSLNRCKINDTVCKKIFENINFGAPAANSLQILELGSNSITDDAAIFIASVLRANRSLLHLNLSGNKITDSGFVPILDSLMEFPLNFKEKVDSARRKLKYLQSKEAIYERSLSNLKSRNMDEFASHTSMPSVPLSKSSKSVRRKSKISYSIEEEAEIMTNGILGEFQDPFSNDDVMVKNEARYCKGNLVLCYINIAYNNLENLSVKRLYDVLRYQDGMRVKSQSGKEKTGLIKITLDGNRFHSTYSPLLEEINSYLQKVIFLRTSGRNFTFRKADCGAVSQGKIHH